MPQKTKIEKHIDAFIEHEKQLNSSPFLATRIITAIENRSNRLTILLKYSIAAVSLLMILSAGIGISIFNKPLETTSVVESIDDYIIENYTYLTFFDHE